MTSPSNIRIPEDIPTPFRDTFQNTFERSVLSMPMDIGAPRQRRIRSVAPRRFTLTFTMNLIQYQEFDYWYQNVIKGGSLEFDIQLLDDDSTLVWFTCNMIGDYTFQNINNSIDSWSISMTVRSKYASFTDRPSGTDEIEGLIQTGATLVGALHVPYVMRGIIDLSVVVQTQLGAGKMLGSISNEIDAFARFRVEYFQARVDVGVTAQAQF